MDRRTFLQRAASVGLAAGPAWRLALSGPIPAGQIVGHVVSGDKPLAGVRVSDGRRVVVTDEGGRFQLETGPDSGPFVFVTIPGGHWTNRFFVPTSTAHQEPLVFELEPISQPEQPEHEAYRVVYLTDVHLGEGQQGQSAVRMAATIEELNQLQPQPVFYWVGGDITLQGGRGAEYVQLMSRLKRPLRNAVGNHEMLVRHPNPRDRFQELFGPTYYSFDVGRIHYVTLDGCLAKPDVQGYQNVEGVFSQRELAWLAEDLRQTPDGMTTVVAIHIPLVSDFPGRRGTTAAEVPWWVVANADEVIEILSAHNVTLVLQGHLHENRRLRQGDIEFVESISICGKWWRSEQGERENGVSGEPRGYRILDVQGTTVGHRYQSSGESRVEAVGEILDLSQPFPVGRDRRLLINIFDGDDRTRVWGSIDDTPFVPLAPTADASHYVDLQAAHHWQWPLTGQALTAGRHRLRVRVEEPDRPPELLEAVAMASDA